MGYSRRKLITPITTDTNRTAMADLLMDRG